MIGQRFGKLKVVSSAPRAASGNIMYHCQCDCGETTLTSASHLRIGKTRSCGCLRTESAARATLAATTHGMKNTATYRVWAAMLSRCRNPNAQQYRNYGARGIAVCKRWHKFEGFLADMGVCPEGMSLDRHPNVNGGYKPSNCRWATTLQQARNKQNTIYLEYNGVRKSLRDWEDDLGLPKEVIYGRVKNGWSVERAIETPYQSQKAHPR